MYTFFIYRHYLLVLFTVCANRICFLLFLLTFSFCKLYLLVVSTVSANEVLKQNKNRIHFVMLFVFDLQSWDVSMSGLH